MTGPDRKEDSYYLNIIKAVSEVRLKDRISAGRAREKLGISGSKYRSAEIILQRRGYDLSKFRPRVYLPRFQSPVIKVHNAAVQAPRVRRVQKTEVRSNFPLVAFYGEAQDVVKAIKELKG